MPILMLDPFTYFLILVALQVFDLLSTYGIILHGGYERNRILIKLSHELSAFTNARWAWLVIAKLIGIALCYLIYLTGGVIVMEILAIIYVLVLLNNLRALYILTRN